MAGVRETDRKAGTVNSDDRIYGAVGEEWFRRCVLPIVKKRGWTCFDCTGIKEFQGISVDYILSKKGSDVRPSAEEVLSNRDDYVLVECKCDTWGWKTRHLYWEVQNKMSRGWSEKMECDWLFYAHPETDEKFGTDEDRTNKMVRDTREVLLVDAKKFREFKNATVDIDINALKSREDMHGPNGRWYRRRDTYEKDTSNTERNLIIDIDFNIEEMREDGVVVWRKEGKDLLSFMK